MQAICSVRPPTVQPTHTGPTHANGHTPPPLTTPGRPAFSCQPANCDDGFAIDSNVSSTQNKQKGAWELIQLIRACYLWQNCHSTKVTWWAGFRHPGTYPKKPVGFFGGKPTSKTHLKNMSALLFVLPIIKHFIQFIVVEVVFTLTLCILIYNMYSIIYYIIHKPPKPVGPAYFKPLKTQ